MSLPAFPVTGDPETAVIIMAGDLTMHLVYGGTPVSFDPHGAVPVSRNPKETRFSLDGRPMTGSPLAVVRPDAICPYKTLFCGWPPEAADIHSGSVLVSFDPDKTGGGWRRFQGQRCRDEKMFSDNRPFNRALRMRGEGGSNGGQKEYNH